MIDAASRAGAKEGDARDLDDAVMREKNSAGGGGWRRRVAIADVSWPLRVRARLQRQRARGIERARAHRHVGGVLRRSILMLPGKCVS